MGYGIAFVFAIVGLFVLLMLTRRAGGANTSRGEKQHIPHGITVEGPASDQPTPQAERTINRIGIDAAKKIPPG